MRRSVIVAYLALLGAFGMGLLKRRMVIKTGAAGSAKSPPGGPLASMGRPMPRTLTHYPSLALIHISVLGKNNIGAMKSSGNGEGRISETSSTDWMCRQTDMMPSLQSRKQSRSVLSECGAPVGERELRGRCDGGATHKAPRDT